MWFFEHISSRMVRIACVNSLGMCGPMKKTNSQRGREAQAHGAAAEAATCVMLRLAGVNFLQKIHTGWKIRRGPGGRVIGATACDRVAGDFFGCDQVGRIVLVEVKYRHESLAWCDLEDHQHAALSAVKSCGGHAFVVWVSSSKIYLMRYPMNNWAHRSPLNDVKASAISVNVSDLIHDEKNCH